MLDGELEPASIRRVLVHSDACPSCRGFLDGIRNQLRAHRELAGLGLIGTTASGLGHGPDAAIRDQLMRNRGQLARILYELGRAYVLMGTSPRFSREVAQEPVPIPDMATRGRNLLDEVHRLTSGAAGGEWVRAKELFGPNPLGSPAENMAKGKRLLVEVLMLRPDFHEARIYLGHTYHVCEERELARREFRAVLDSATDPIMRAFALENLGNVYLEEGRPAGAIPYFLQLVESGAIRSEPRFFTTYFNLALAYGLTEEFDECRTWFGRLHHEFPHKRRLVGKELRGRTQLASILKKHADVEKSFATAFPGWFPVPVEVS